MLREHALLGKGLYLYLDVLIVSLANWMFWLVILKITSPTEIGLATTVISLIAVLSIVFGLGLEFPLLRDSRRPGVVYSLLIFQIVLLATVVPIALVLGNLFFGSALGGLLNLAVIYLLLTGVHYIVRHAVLGLLKSEMVLLFDVMGAVARFAIGITLVLSKLGALGIVLAVTGQTAVVAVGLLLVCFRNLKPRLLGFGELKALLRLGLSNMPGRMAQVSIFGLSVLALAILVPDPAVVGRYYIALTISFVAGSVAFSLATMSLPTSSLHEMDSSNMSLKYGISLTTPAIAALLATPSLILSFIGSDYILASKQLQILALAILPWAIVLNVVAKLNYQKMMKRLIFLGIVQLVFFILPLLIFVNAYGALVAPISVLTSSLAAGMLSMKWLGRDNFKTILISSLAILGGWSVGSLAAQMSQIGGFVLALVIPISIILVFRLIIPKEFLGLVRSTIRNNKRAEMKTDKASNSQEITDQ